MCSSRKNRKCAASTDIDEPDKCKSFCRKSSFFMWNSKTDECYCKTSGRKSIPWSGANKKKEWYMVSGKTDCIIGESGYIRVRLCPIFHPSSPHIGDYVYNSISNNFSQGNLHLRTKKQPNKRHPKNVKKTWNIVGMKTLRRMEN